MSHDGGLGEPQGGAKTTTPSGAGTDLRTGLPMVAKWEPEKLAKDNALLVALEQQPTMKRWAGYAKRLGPGFMQSAMTLGSGSAASSLFAGALVGYGLLWVQPLAMFFGVIMMMAIAYLTLSTGARPFDALRRHVSPSLAWTFAICSLLATLIWHFPQYSMGSAVGADLLKLAGLPIPSWSLAVVMLIACTAVTWSYGSGARGIRIYETVIKYLVWAIVFLFLAVVVKLAAVGRIDWGAVARGLVPFTIPEGRDAQTAMFGGFGAAVGINMVFLFPYTLLARGWGKEHRACSRFDLFAGMFVPFTLATGLMVMATAATLYAPGVTPASVGPSEASAALEPVVGAAVGRVVFGLGILGMCLSTITLHMLVCGFIACECLGWEPVGPRYYAATLIPAIGVLGPVVSKSLPLWLPVVTSAVSGALLPVAYIGFAVLFNKRAFMGDAMPKGSSRALWNLGIAGAVLLSVLYFVGVCVFKVAPWISKTFLEG